MDDQSKQDQTQSNAGSQNDSGLAPAQDPVSPSEPNFPESATSGAVASAGNPVPFMNIVVVALVLAVVGGGTYWFFNMRGGSETQNNQFDLPTQSVNREYPEVVATVGGQEIGREEFEKTYVQVAQTAAQQGANLNDPSIVDQIEQQAISILVNRAVLLQATEAAGIKVTPEEVDAQILSIEEQYGGAEALQEQVDLLGLSTEQLRTDIEEQLVIDAFIRASAEFEAISIGDEEVQAAYDSLAESAPSPAEMPAFEDLSEQIRLQLVAQAEQAAAAQLVERLRNEAAIELAI